MRKEKERRENGLHVAMFSVWPDGNTKQKRGKCGGVVDGVVDGVVVNGVVNGVVDSGMLRGSGAPSGLGLAEGGQGLCRAQPVTGTAASTLGSTLIKG